MHFLEVLGAIVQLGLYAAMIALAWLLCNVWYNSFMWAYEQRRLLRAALCFLIPPLSLVLMAYQYRKNRFGLAQDQAHAGMASMFRSASWKL